MVAKCGFVKIMARGNQNWRHFCVNLLICLIYFPMCLSEIIHESSRKIGKEMLLESKDVRNFDLTLSELYFLSENLKYILLWTPNDFAPFYYFGTGQNAFVYNQCPHINCYVTSNRKLFDKITTFDAIAFNGRNIDISDLPKERSANQKYIFMMSESADNYPICGSILNNFFNLTVTYRLDSDIPMPYIVVKNTNNVTIGPKTMMDWPKTTADVNEEIFKIIDKKTKLAAWFVSNCRTYSRRENYINKLRQALIMYGKKVKIYGRCRGMPCPTKLRGDCDKMLETDYFFYLAFENSFAEDYVTEKVLLALQNNVVPVVYGGANYSRFMPPGSYINAVNYTPGELAKLMYELSRNKTKYSEFFKWKALYTFNEPGIKDHVCALCAAMNNKKMMSQQKSYDNFLSWWQPDYEKRCSSLYRFWNWLMELIEL